MPDGHYSDLQLAVTGQNFIATVTVSGSQTETGSAETKIGSYTIFDLTSQKLGRSTVLHLPESDFRYLHFRIKGPLSPESVTGFSVVRLSATQAEVSDGGREFTSGAERPFFGLEFTVPAHVPVDRIVFTPGASPAQFSRDVSDQRYAGPLYRQQSMRPSRAAGDFVWQPVARSQRAERPAPRRRAPGNRCTSGWISVRRQNGRSAIENGDDAPLQLESVRLEMLERSLCFEADRLAAAIRSIMAMRRWRLRATTTRSSFTLQANATQSRRGRAGESHIPASARRAAIYGKASCLVMGGIGRCDSRCWERSRCAR